MSDSQEKSDAGFTIAPPVDSQARPNRERPFIWKGWGRVKKAALSALTPGGRAAKKSQALKDDIRRRQDLTRIEKAFVATDDAIQMALAQFMRTHEGPWAGENSARWFNE